MSGAGTIKERIETRAKPVFEWWDIIRKLLGIVCTTSTALWLVWVQFIGPGLQSSFRDWSGITAIEAHLDSLPPPRVVDWNMVLTGQSTECFAGSTCVVIMVGARTEYGEKCGRPSKVTYELTTSAGRTYTITAPTFKPVELSRQEKSFELPLLIPSVVPSGNHSIVGFVTYDHCPGRNEPIERQTPPIKLVITARR